MITISLCMIVKNEEHCIANCLESVFDIVDEIVIVDTGSTDGTKGIVNKYTEKVYDFQWINDFSSARNYAFNLATKEYILWLDADDLLLEDGRTKLKNLKNTLDKSIDYVNMIYDITFNEMGECTFSTVRERLVKNFKGFYWDCFMHERLNVWGKEKFIDIHITHRKNHHENRRNLEIFQSKMKEGYFLNTRESYFYGAELYLGKYYDDAIRVLDDFLREEHNDNFEKVNGLLMQSDCYNEKQEYAKALECCFKTFTYEVPKAEILYKIANLFQKQKKYVEAISWYQFLLTLNTEEIKKDNDQASWLSYLPHQQLCCCYYEIGDLKNSYLQNELAAKYNQDDPYVIENRKLFSTLGFAKNK